MELLTKLTSFKEAKGNFDEKLEYLDEQFKEIAKIMLCKGHLEFGDTKVYIRDVEFYYHEENGIMKDPIMYHTNDERGEKEYLKPGSFHFHVSGVDITFENKESKFRASALIRGYSEDSPEKEVEWRPTYLYNLFNCLSPFEKTTVEWVENDNLAETGIRQTYRQNVPLYCQKDKENVVVLNPDYIKNGRNDYKAIDYTEKPVTFVLKGKKKKMNYSKNIKTKSTKKIQDTIHLWRFCREVDLKDIDKEYIK